MYDILIIGAGSAGLPCAIQAAKRGLKVLVIEKSIEVGGTLHITAGHLSAGGTAIQKQKAITDSPAEHWYDVQRISKHTADEVIAKKAVELAPATIDWLQSLGYQLHDKAPLIIHGHEAYNKPRTYFGRDDYFGGAIMQPGKAVLKALLPHFEKYVANGAITLYTNTTLQKLNVVNNEVQSITVLQNNEAKTITAKKYVVTTGGYAANKIFFEQQHQGLTLVSTAKETSTGDGIQKLLEVGGVFHNAHKHIFTLGGIETEKNSGRANFWTAWARVSNSHDRVPREIYVNVEGKRFMNEHDLTVDERERIVLQQTGQQFYVVFDEVSLNAGPTVVVQWSAEQLKEVAAKEQCCWAATSIEALATKINIPQYTLLQTVAAYNNAVSKKQDDLFNRTNLTHPLTTPPYYALLVKAYALISFGGIKVNETLQVVDNNDKAFNNLYAAGEILGAGATSGNAFCGGMLLTPAISFGKWLGETLI